MGNRFARPLPMPAAELQAQSLSARSCTCPPHTQLCGLLLTDLYRAFVSATFLLSQ